MDTNILQFIVYSYLDNSTLRLLNETMYYAFGVNGLLTVDFTIVCVMCTLLLEMY